MARRRAVEAEGTDAVAVRAATAADLDEVVAIERLAFSDPWSRASFAALVDVPHVAFLVAERVLGGRRVLAGYVVAWFVVDEAEIANLAVAPSARRLGLGARLLDAAIAQAGTRGSSAIYLEVRRGNVAAQALYASRGFVHIGQRRNYYRNPVEDALVLRRTIAPSVTG